MLLSRLFYYNCKDCTIGGISIGIHNIVGQLISTWCIHIHIASDLNLAVKLIRRIFIILDIFYIAQSVNLGSLCDLNIVSCEIETGILGIQPVNLCLFPFLGLLFFGQSLYLLRNPLLKPYQNYPVNLRCPQNHYWF